jgi:hypothetical protein
VPVRGDPTNHGAYFIVRGDKGKIDACRATAPLDHEGPLRVTCEGRRATLDLLPMENGRPVGFAGEWRICLRALRTDPLANLGGSEIDTQLSCNGTSSDEHALTLPPSGQAILPTSTLCVPIDSVGEDPLIRLRWTPATQSGHKSVSCPIPIPDPLSGAFERPHAEVETQCDPFDDIDLLLARIDSEDTSS